MSSLVELTLPPLVDAHHHLWDLEHNYHPWLCDEHPIPFRYGDYRKIRQSYLPADYRRDTADFEVARTIYVEAEWDPKDPIGETKWIHAVAEQAGFPHAMVAQAWLDRDDCAQVLAAQAAYPLVRSIRHKPRAVASPDLRKHHAGGMEDLRWRDGYAQLEGHGFRFDLQTPHWHLDEAARLAADFPRTPLVVNHAGWPADRSPDGMKRWRTGMDALADLENVAVKISGLGQRNATWSIDANRQVVQELLSMFGPDRCMFASNFPVDSLVVSFQALFDGFRELTRGNDEVTRRKLFCENAIRIYDLEPIHETG